jgi:hypothetical protein
MNFISVTDLQRNTKTCLEKPGFQVIMHNNNMKGMILSQQASELLMDSGVLPQIQEELYEINNKETVDVIQNHRSNKSKPILFDSLIKKYEL